MIQYREINVDHVKSAIREPDFTKKAFEDRVMVCKRVDADRVIKVVYYKDGFRDSNDFIVVTAYYTSNC